MLQQQAQAYLQPSNPDPAKMSPQDAQRRFDDAEAKLKQTRDKTVQTAKDAADASAAAASKTSFAAFGNLLLGALFAAIGGSLAVQRRLQVSNRVTA
jgi:hypothetical protein